MDGQGGRGAAAASPSPDSSSRKKKAKKKIEGVVSSGHGTIHQQGRTKSANDAGNGCSLSKKDLLAIAAILIVAIATRCYRLGIPSEVVFDEVHFGGFMMNYLRGEYFFDIHPPLGKLLHVGAGWWAELDYPSQTFEHIGNPIPDRNFVYVRLVSATISSLTAPLTYLIAREMGGSIPAALVSASLFVLEGTILVSSRLILTDAALWFFGALTLYCFLRLWHTEDADSARAPMMRASWWFWCLAAGLSMGCVVSVKWTGLGFVGTAGVAHLLRLRRQLLCAYMQTEEKPTGKKVAAGKSDHDVGLFWSGLIGGVITVLLMCLVYYAMWVIHFVLLTKKGPGDLWHGEDFLLSRDRAANGTYSMFDMIVEVHLKMFEANKNLQTGHSYGSVWYRWPLMEKSIAYWTRTNELGTGRVTLGGNEAVFATTTVAVAWFSVFALSTWVRWDEETLTQKQRSHCVWGSWLLFGYFINLLPYVLVTRVCFLYHYVPPLYFAILLVSLIVDKYLREPLDRPLTVCGVIACACFCFYLHHPTIYALPM